MNLDVLQQRSLPDTMKSINQILDQAYHQNTICKVFHFSILYPDLVQTIDPFMQRDQHLGDIQQLTAI